LKSLSKGLITACVVTSAIASSNALAEQNPVEALQASIAQSEAFEPEEFQLSMRDKLSQVEVVEESNYNKEENTAYTSTLLCVEDQFEKGAYKPAKLANLTSNADSAFYLVRGEKNGLSDDYKYKIDHDSKMVEHLNTLCNDFNQQGNVSLNYNIKISDDSKLSFDVKINEIVRAENIYSSKASDLEDYFVERTDKTNHEPIKAYDYKSASQNFSDAHSLYSKIMYDNMHIYNNNYIGSKMSTTVEALEGINISTLHVVSTLKSFTNAQQVDFLNNNRLTNIEISKGDLDYYLKNINSKNTTSKNAQKNN
jgi:hypothetical protein